MSRAREMMEAAFPVLVMRDQLWAMTQSPSEGVACPPEEDVARQEFKDECDISYQMRRFGAGMPFPPRYGVQDDTVDLLGAFEIMDRASEAFRALPPEVQRMYKSVGELWKAFEAGELVVGEPPKPAAGAAGGSAAAGGGSPSDSAAGGGA